MSESSSRDDEAEFDYYLPGMPSLSSGPGRVEQFLTRLFRRRGGLKVVYRRR
jgi:hypothetical protein